MSRVTKIIVLSMPCLIVLATGEIYLRYQYNREHNRLVSKYKGRELTTTWSEDPRLIYTLIPNQNGTNSRGYLDYEHPYDKTKGTFRLVIIGDSIAQGQGVELEESFGRVLERTLNDLSPKSRYEVIVLARTGYSTSQELVLLEKEAFLYDPDVIIWSYVLNDPAHPVYHNVNGELGRYFYKPKFHLLDFVLKKLFVIAEELKGKNCEKEYHKFLHCVYWNGVQTNINKIGEISKRRKTPLIVLVHPIFEKGESFREYTLMALHARLSEILSKAGLIPIDLLDAYRQYDPNEIKQHNKNGFNFWHPNAKGHEIIADHLFKKLKSDGLTQLQ